MTGKQAEKVAGISATVISYLFHPLLMPLYGMLIIFSAPTLFGLLPLKFKKTLLFIVLINNVLLPLSLLPYFKLRNIITSWTIPERSERIIPVFATTFFYYVTLYLILKYQIPVFLKAYVLSAAVLSTLMAFINFRMKVSMHSAGAGALIALVIVLSIRMHTPLTLLLIGAVLMSGIILSSRLWLDVHTPREVWTGFFVGAFVPALLLTLF